MRSDERGPWPETPEIDIELGDWVCGVLEGWGRYYMCCRFTISHSDAESEDEFPNASHLLESRQRSRDRRTIRSGDLHVVVRSTL